MHTHASQILDESPPEMMTGRVEGRLDAIYTVSTSHELFQAYKAVSCLIEPEPGDTVLIGNNTGDHMFILAILTRETPTPSTLPFPHGVRIHAPGNPVDIAGDEVLVQAQSTLKFASREASLESESATMRTHRFQLFSEMVHAGVGIAEIVAENLDTLCDRVVVRSKRSYRYVEELEQACLGRLRCLVDGTLFLRGRKASLNAEETVSIDGEEVHLG